MERRTLFLISRLLFWIERRSSIFKITFAVLRIIVSVLGVIVVIVRIFVTIFQNTDSVFEIRIPFAFHLCSPEFFFAPVSFRLKCFEICVRNVFGVDDFWAELSTTLALCRTYAHQALVWALRCVVVVAIDDVRELAYRVWRSKKICRFRWCSWVGLHCGREFNRSPSDDTWVFLSSISCILLGDE